EEHVRLARFPWRTRRGDTWGLRFSHFSGVKKETWVTGLLLLLRQVRGKAVTETGPRAQIFRPTGTVYSRLRGPRGLLANRGFADISCTRSRNLVVRHLFDGIIVQDLQSSGVYSYGGSFFRVVHPAELAAAG